MLFFFSDVNEIQLSKLHTNTLKLICIILIILKIGKSVKMWCCKLSFKPKLKGICSAYNHSEHCYHGDLTR